MYGPLCTIKTFRICRCLVLELSIQNLLVIIAGKKYALRLETQYNLVRYTLNINKSLQ